MITQYSQTSANLKFTLDISDSEVPNKTLSANWYDGEQPVQFLFLHAVEILVIEAYAFNATALNDLLILGISNLLHILDYHAGMFIGLGQLKECMLTERAQRSHSVTGFFLLPLQAELEVFVYTGDFGTGSMMNELFGGVEMELLEDISVTCLENRFHLISSENFTGLPVVEELRIAYCGIEVIDVGAFDRIVDTLQRLALVGNPLLQLNFDRFRLYLDKWNAITTKRSKHLQLYEDDTLPFKCSMDFYRLRNASLISFKYHPERIRDLACKHDIHEEDGGSQQSLQAIHPARLHLNHTGILKYTFPKFRLLYDAARRQLKVAQWTDADNYRLFIWAIGANTLPMQNASNEDQWHCPLPIWSTTNVGCQRRNRSEEVVIIPKFDDRFNDLIAVCVIHVSMPKQSVPLHCSTIRVADRLASSNHFFVVMFLVISVFVAIMAIFFMFWKCILMNIGG